MKFGFKSWQNRLLIFLAVLGPGFITSTADHDAGGITTYALIGAHEGYGLLWVLVLTVFVMAVVQEMSARLGIVTGQGLAGLIRERFGLRMTILAMLLLFVANIFVTISNYSGIAASLELFNVSRLVSVPLFLGLIILVIIKGNYKIIERVFLFSSLFYISYIIAGFLAKPRVPEMAAGLIPTFKTTPNYLILIIALIGTTITPWMQFYLQSSIAEKRVKTDHLSYAAWEAYFGSIFTNIISFFIIITTAATLFKSGIRIDNAEHAALALKPLAGEYFAALFAVGLLNASILAAAILPVSTAYAICEAFGWESGIDKRFHQARIFYSIFIITTLCSGIVVLIPHLDLIKVIVFSQTANGILLPFVLIFMLIIINDAKIMGSYCNSRLRNIIAWITVIALIILTILLVFYSILDPTKIV